MITLAKISLCFLSIPSAKHKLFIGLCKLFNTLLRYNNDYVGVTYTGHHMFIIQIIKTIDHNLTHTYVSCTNKIHHITVVTCVHALTQLVIEEI